MRPAQVRAKTHGGLIFASPEFYAFICVVENIYLFNLTPDKLDAYPSDLATRVHEFVSTCKEPRRVMNEVIIPLLPAQIDREVPEEFYAFVFKKFSMLRSKDLARALDRAHARERTSSATAANVALRRNLAAVSAAASAKAKASRG